MLRDVGEFQLLNENTSTCNHYFQVPGLAEGRPSIMKGDRVYVREKQGEVKYEGVVHIVEADAVYLAFNHQ